MLPGMKLGRRHSLWFPHEDAGVQRPSIAGTSPSRRHALAVILLVVAIVSAKTAVTDPVPSVQIQRPVNAALLLGTR